MKRIMQNSTVLATLQTPTWVRRQENGSLTLCTETEAQGVVVDGQVYHITGREALEGHEDVMVAEIDEMIYQKEQEEHLQAASLPAAIIFVTLAETKQLDDVTVREHAELFSNWVPGMEYGVGAVRNDPEDGNLYRCEQKHTSQAGWEPHAVPALWTKIPGLGVEYPQWGQPIGSRDSYPKGAKVTDEGKKWVSEVDNNVWKPGVFGWAEEKEDTNE